MRNFDMLWPLSDAKASLFSTFRRGPFTATSLRHFYIAP